MRAQKTSTLRLVPNRPDFRESGEASHRRFAGELVKWPYGKQGAASAVEIMEHDLQTWDLAKVMLERYGTQAMHGARAVSATIQDQEARPDGTNCHDIVRVMDFLLSDDMDQTIH